MLISEHGFITSLLQAGVQGQRRSTLLLVDGDHTDQVGLIRVNVCKHTAQLVFTAHTPSRTQSVFVLVAVSE